MATATLEVWVCVDAAGDYATGATAEAARTKYEEDIGALVDADGFRLVALTVEVPLPAPIEVSVEVPDEEPEPVVTVK